MIFYCTTGLSPCMVNCILDAVDVVAYSRCILFFTALNYKRYGRNMAKNSSLTGIAHQAIVEQPQSQASQFAGREM